MKSAVTTLGTMLICLTVLGCGQTPAETNDRTDTGSRGHVIIEQHRKPLGVKERHSEKPTVGYRPPMPAQKRVTNPPVTRTRITGNLVVPWDMEFTASGDTLFFTERPGRVSVIHFTDTGPRVERWLTREQVLHWGEGGLMGMALHPSFGNGEGSDNWVYLCETYGQYESARNRIVRIRYEPDQAMSRDVLIPNMPAASYHDGCRLEFGPGGMLYATMGDAGNPPSAQDLSSWSGKILRMTPSGKPAPGNPFEGTQARPYVYSFGHRNPQGIDWHPTTHTIYSSEHGPSGEFGLSGHDEINRIVKGANYGWPEVIGAPDIKPYRDPVLMFPHPHLPPAGMDFTDRYERSNKTVSLFVGSLRGEALLRVVFRGPEIIDLERWFEQEFFTGTMGRIRAVETGPDGRLFIATSNRDGRGDPRKHDDQIIRLDPAR